MLDYAWLHPKNTSYQEKPMQLKQLVTISLVSILGLLPYSANAGIEKGDKTVSIFGSLTSPSDGDDQLFLSAAGGLFLTDTLEGQAVVYLIDSGPFTISSYGTNANLYVPAKNPDLIPFVGGGLTITIIDAPPIDETELGFNVQGGIKQFINESVSINYQLQYVDAGDYDATILSVGFSIFLE